MSFRVRYSSSRVPDKGKRGGSVGRIKIVWNIRQWPRWIYTVDCYMALMEAHGASGGGAFVIFLIPGYCNGLNASAC